MGNCQVVPTHANGEIFSEEMLKARVDNLKKFYHSKGSPSTISFNVYNRFRGHGWSDMDKHVLAWENAVKLAFSNKAYIITYSYPHGYAVADMHVSFVQLPSPFAQPDPISPPPTESSGGRTGQEIRDAYARKRASEAEAEKTAE
jgi:hypothetical protein